MDREVIKIEGDQREELLQMATDLRYRGMEFKQLSREYSSFSKVNGKLKASAVLKRKSDGKFFRVTTTLFEKDFGDYESNLTLVEVFPHQVTKTVFKDEPQNLHRHNDIYFLKALVEAGVDNWEGYDMAIDRYEVDAARKTVKQ